jgi:heme oxygenase
MNPHRQSEHPDPPEEGQPHAHPSAHHSYPALQNGPVQVHVGAPGADGGPVGTGVMDRLRAQTLPHHQRAESHRWQRAMAKGRLSQRQYAMWLGQMRHVHHALESALGRHAATNPHIAAVVDPVQFQLPHVDADLAYYGGDPLPSTALPAVAAAVITVERTARADTTRLLGLHYVIEGSKNGGRFIVRALRRAYNLPPGHGDRSMDPYGEHQPAVWSKFKSDMNARHFDSPTCDAIVASAADMFDAFYDVSEDLARREGLGDEA